MSRCWNSMFVFRIPIVTFDSSTVSTVYPRRHIIKPLYNNHIITEHQMRCSISCLRGDKFRCRSTSTLRTAFFKGLSCRRDTARRCLSIEDLCGPLWRQFVKLSVLSATLMLTAVQLNKTSLHSHRALRKVTYILCCSSVVSSLGGKYQDGKTPGPWPLRVVAFTPTSRRVSSAVFSTRIQYRVL